MNPMFTTQTDRQYRKCGRGGRTRILAEAQSNRILAFSSLMAALLPVSRFRYRESNPDWNLFPVPGRRMRANFVVDRRGRQRDRHAGTVGRSLLERCRLRSFLRVQLTNSDAQERRSRKVTFDSRAFRTAPSNIMSDGRTRARCTRTITDSPRVLTAGPQTSIFTDLYGHLSRVPPAQSLPTGRRRRSTRADRGSGASGPDSSRARPLERPRDPLVSAKRPVTRV